MADMRPIVHDGPLSGGRSVAASRFRYQRPADPSCRPVTHSYAALTFVTAGRSRVEQNGQWALEEGDVMLVPAGMQHRTLEARRPEFWGLALCVPCLAADGAVSLLRPLERVRDGGSAVVRIPSARHEYLAMLFGELAALAQPAVGSGDAIEGVQRSLLTLILAEVDRAAGSAPVGSPAVGSGVGGGVVVEALRYIERHCLGRLTLEDVAAAIGRTPAYVTTALTHATGRSAGKWIAAGRMAEARRLLLHSDTRIEAIAERVGYADATHFIRMFRREQGATPAAWRAAQRADARSIAVTGPVARRAPSRTRR